MKNIKDNKIINSNIPTTINEWDMKINLLNPRSNTDIINPDHRMAKFDDELKPGSVERMVLAKSIERTYHLLAENTRRYVYSNPNIEFNSFDDLTEEQIKQLVEAWKLQGLSDEQKLSIKQVGSQMPSIYLLRVDAYANLSVNVSNNYLLENLLGKLTQGLPLTEPSETDKKSLQQKISKNQEQPTNIQ